MSAAGKPLMYGYVRGLPGMPVQTAYHFMQDMRPFAQSQGFAFGSVFFENDRLHAAAWNALIRTCRRTGTRDVVLPDLRHLHTVPALRGASRTVFENTIGGRLWVLAPAPVTPAGDSTRS